MNLEILSPAGSFDTMKAVIAAGADAVYMGLNKFSARAYADNAASEDYSEAIRYAHLHGKKLYLTINTLFKEKELFGELKNTLEPLYVTGLDAVIVQDIGVMRCINAWFPDLPIHISTQGYVTGPESAKFYQKLNVTRVVPAREMSLQEVRTIKETTGLEMECFVHGALCYSYSGQCLFSSIVGGRSGNRGRCAQPCRMPYQVNEKGKPQYILSLKDLCTIDLIPDLVEAGVDSFKIEGRMKKAEYAAGVTFIYRKYLDQYLALKVQFGAEGAKKKYKVLDEDRKNLFDLFNRKGFTDGYYTRHNSEKMLTMTEPDFREKNSDFLHMVHDQFIKQTHKSGIKGFYSFSEGAPMYMHISAELDGQTFETDVLSDTTVETASGRSAVKEEVEKSLGKLGNTAYYWEELTGELGDHLFLPVSQLNGFRRQAIEAITETINSYYTRKTVQNVSEEITGELQEDFSGMHEISAFVRTKAQFDAVLPFADIICLDSSISDDYSIYVQAVHDAEKKIYLALPQVIRKKVNVPLLQAKQFDGILLRSLEGYTFALETGLPIILDHNLYAFNSAAKGELLSRKQVVRCTVPVELNSREIESTGYSGQEMIVYGRLPMMISANCIQRSSAGCDHKPKILTLKDRMGNVMPVVTDCKNCMNTIYNALPVNLSDSSELIRIFSLSCVRLNFTVESKEETREVIRDFVNAFKYHQKVVPSGSFTRGHFKRGVE